MKMPSHLTNWQLLQDAKFEVHLMDPDKKEEHHKEAHHSHKVNNSKKFNFDYVIYGIIFVLAIVLVINVVLTLNLNTELKKGSEAAQEKARPARIELTSIKNSKCTDCADISAIAIQIKNLNVNVTKERTLEYNSKEGKEIIAKYKLDKIPNIVITGEIDKVSIQGLDKKDDALLLTDINPPYTNAVTGEVIGKVTLYLLKDDSCAKCNDINILIAQIKSAGVKIYNVMNVTTQSSRGKELIEKYKIDFAPALILSKDASAYDVMQKAWQQVGTIESDGSYVLRQVYPPFVNLTTGKTRGLASIVYLVDNSCAECYDVRLHEEILTSPQSFAITFEKEETVDVSDSKGKELIAKYNISQVPTTILSSEVTVYPSSAALKQFFSVEKDGSYVFRQPKVLGTYKDLTNNQIVKVQEQTQVQ